MKANWVKVIKKLNSIYIFNYKSVDKDMVQKKTCLLYMFYCIKKYSSIN